MTKAYFIVEGPHDAEVVGRFLRLRGFERLQKLENLDPYWQALVPRTFPHGGDLLKRVPVPVFFADPSTGRSVAVHSAGGDVVKIGNALEATLLGLDELPDGIGVLIDGDAKPAARWEEAKQELGPHLPGLGLAEEPGKILGDEPRVGVYILPDNGSQGTLEDLLLACARHAYPELLKTADKWVSSLDPMDKQIFKDDKERQDFKKPFGPAKATVGCISSILRPGRAIQVSIQDNRWLRDSRALEEPTVQNLRAFVDGILGV